MGRLTQDAGVKRKSIKGLRKGFINLLTKKGENFRKCGHAHRKGRRECREYFSAKREGKGLCCPREKGTG